MTNDGDLRRDHTRSLWIAESARAADASLASTALGVRPPDSRVPRDLHGSSVGALFGRLVRTADGRAHASLKRAAREALAGVDLDDVAAPTGRLAARLTGDATEERALAIVTYDLAIAIVASLLGFDDPHAALAAARTHDIVRALLPNASADAVSRGSLSVDVLRSELLAIGGTDAAPTALFATFARTARAAEVDDEIVIANAIGFLWQSADAMASFVRAALVELASETRVVREAVRADAAARDAFLRDRIRTAAPIEHTRRFAARDVRIGGAEVRAGDEIVVSLADAAFGEYAHACPGRAIAFAIGSAVIREILDANLDAFVSRRTTYLARPNARIPSFGDNAR